MLLMRSGTLQYPIEIWKCEIEETDFGHIKREYKYFKSTRCSLDRKDGAKIIQNDEIIFDYTKTFYVRQYVQVEEGWHIKFDGRFYEIQSIVKNPMTHEIKLGTKIVEE